MAMWYPGVSPQFMRCLAKVTHSLWMAMWSESQSCHRADALVTGVLAAFGRPGRPLSPAAPVPAIAG